MPRQYQRLAVILALASASVGSPVDKCSSPAYSPAKLLQTPNVTPDVGTPSDPQPEQFNPPPNTWTLAIPSSLTQSVMGHANYSFVADSTNVGSQDLRINYPKGTFRSPHNGQTSRGGSQFYMAPFSDAIVASSGMRAVLQYDVFLPADFEFNLGGKLPGVYGQNSNMGGSAGGACSGGIQSDGTNCWSVRLMWRPSGNGEAYVYIPQAANKQLCSLNNTICNPEYGMSLGRSQFKFIRNTWTTVAIHVTLNTPGSNNGAISVVVNGSPAIDVKNVMFVASGANIPVKYIDFSTFFGGSTANYASPIDTYALFRNVKFSLGSV